MKFGLKAKSPIGKRGNNKQHAMKNVKQEKLCPHNKDCIDSPSIRANSTSAICYPTSVIGE